MLQDVGIEVSATSQRVTIDTAHGSVIRQRLDPRDAVAGHTLNTPRDHLHAFNRGGHALWNYIAGPGDRRMASANWACSTATRQRRTT